jgi:hypothetical protein
MNLNKVILLLFMSLNVYGLKNHDYVPDSATAIKIAEAIWLPIYGESIYKKQPFIAKLISDSIWIVTGSIPKSRVEINDGDTIYTIIKGGVPYAIINKKDGCILKVYHTK